MIQKWKKRVAAILLILGGIGLVGYPWISDWCYRVHTQSSVAVYAAEAKEQSDVTEELMQNAIAYNTWLSEAHITLSDPFSGAQIVEKPELPYTSQLALDDSGILYICLYITRLQRRCYSGEQDIWKERRCQLAAPETVR